jgi:hypothetical protein
MPESLSEAEIRLWAEGKHKLFIALKHKQAKAGQEFSEFNICLQQESN